MQKICLIFINKGFQSYSFGEIDYLEKKLQVDVKNSNFENFESTLSMAFVSIPLSTTDRCIYLHWEHK